MNTRRSFLTTSLAGAAANLVAAPAPARPNVLIFLADDLGWNDVGFHRSEIATPNIDRLAASGVRFERFYSYPLCSPTRSALMTGRSPMRLGVGYHVIRPWLDYGVAVEEHFMPQSFKAAGYQTGMAGKWHLGHSRVKFWPQNRGFDSAYGHMNGAIDYFTHIRDGGLDWHRNGKSVKEDGYTTDLIGSEVIRFIKNRDRSRPFFFYTPFNAPHSPLQAPGQYLEPYAPIQDQRRRTFAAMVTAMDANVGRVLQTLDDERIADNTIVLFFSDNGGPVAQGARNTPLRGGKTTPWEGGTRVPAVLRWPGRLKAGSASRQMMTVMDVFPTLAAAAGVRPGNRRPLDGENLWANLASGTARVRENQFFAVENKGFGLALHHREWKLVREIPPRGEPQNSLFRVEQDPSEKNDLAARYPEVVRDLAARCDQWQALYPAGGTRAQNEPPAGWKAPPQWAEAART